jgi:hypothetical protein
MNIFSKTLMFLLIIFKLNFAQSVDGTVMDNNGQPLIGVNVFIENTFIGIQTDSEGHFQIVTDKKMAIYVSSIIYRL